MALRFLDSFDHYSTAEITFKYFKAGSPVIDNSSGRRGSQCLRLTSSSSQVTKFIAPADDGVVCGVAFKASFLQDAEVISIMSGTTQQMSLCVSVTGALQLRRGGKTGTILASTGAGAFTANVFTYLELKATISLTGGSASVQFNGISVPSLTVTGINNANAGTNGWNGVNFRGQGGNLDFDDLYILDNVASGFLGNTRVDSRFPTEDGASQLWSPSTGFDNWALVDDPSPNSDVDYTSGYFVNDTDTLIVQDAIDSTIFGVQMNIFARKTDSVSAAMAPIIRHAGVDNAGIISGLNLTYFYIMQTYGTNPGTGSAWGVADFNAAEFGYKRTT